MKDWKLTEHQLRSWKPRGPSAKLKAKLFPEPEHAAELEGAAPLGAKWAWLAPVMGCFLALMVISNPRTQQLGARSSDLPTNWLEAVARDQSYAAYIVAGFHSGQNALQTTLIEWTTEAESSAEPARVQLQATNTPNRN